MQDLLLKIGINGRRIVAIICFGLMYQCISAQWYDRYWISGYDYNPNLMDTTFGATYFDFFEEPVKVYYNPQHSMSFIEEIGLISNSIGNLQFYSNGMQIQNYNHQIIDGGDTIAFGDFWLNWVLSDGDLTGLPLIQGSIVLPYPAMGITMCFFTRQQM